jgi:D-threo-aldose 1-dehydrogenase
MTTRQVGKTNLHVPMVGIGTGTISGLFRPITQEKAIATIRYVLDNGSPFIDTAPFYGATLSETYVGLALEGRPRDGYVLATKVGRTIHPDGRIEFDFSREAILRGVEGSMKRLKTDRLDVLHLHDADDHFREALDTGFPTLAELRAQGVVKAVGAGMNQWQMLVDFARNADFDCFLLAGRYTLLEQESLGALAEFQARNISLFLGGIYNSGILATGPGEHAKYNYGSAPAAVIEKVKRIADVCDRHHVPLKAAAAQFVRAHPAVTALIIGVESPEQFDENNRMLDVPIPAELWTDLRAAGLIDEAAPTP